MAKSESPTALYKIVQPDRTVQYIDEGIWSALEPETNSSRYDGRARLYDFLIGSRLYNRLMWGVDPAAYRSFARSALQSSPSGWHLDAGCGTLLHTVDAYLASPARPIVAVDLSLDMLIRARKRLNTRVGLNSDHVILLQADLLDLPFQTDCFDSLLCMGMLHLFENPEQVPSRLVEHVRPGRRMFFSYLTKSGRFSDTYLDFLYRKGEVAVPLSRQCRSHLFLNSFEMVRDTQTGNMAFTEVEKSDG